MSKRIEICGGIAAGKTSLAKVLEEDGMLAVYEKMDDNPFLKDFYGKDEIDNTFETEVTCTLMHYNGIKKYLEKEICVYDYSLFQDYCYGINNLEEQDRNAYANLYEYLLSRLPKRDLLIYLKCDVNCLLNRIKERGREVEQTISKEYLSSNIAVMERELKKLSNVLVIESDKYNFLEQDRNYIQKKIRKWIQG